VGACMLVSIVTILRPVPAFSDETHSSCDVLVSPLWTTHTSYPASCSTGHVPGTASVERFQLVSEPPILDCPFGPVIDTRIVGWVKSTNDTHPFHHHWVPPMTAWQTGANFELPPVGLNDVSTRVHSHSCSDLHTSGWTGCCAWFGYIWDAAVVWFANVPQSVRGWLEPRWSSPELSLLPKEEDRSNWHVPPHVFRI
jgi:hypothetical protein